MKIEQLKKCLCHDVALKQIAESNIYVCEIDNRNVKMIVRDQTINWIEFYYDDYVLDYNFLNNKTYYLIYLQDVDRYTLLKDFSYLLPFPTSQEQVIKIFNSLKASRAFL